MEELKIIIKAVTNEAEKNIKEVKKALGEVDSSTKKTSGSFSKLAKSTAIASAAVVGALAAVGVAMKNLEQSTRDYRNEHAKLISAFKASGASAAIAEKTYGNLYRFLGEGDVAVEAANHLARLTVNQQSLAEWAKICQGVYATFGDSLPIEGLTEAANETARVGKVTGVMADALNWMGVSEDSVNEKLAQSNTLAEREALLRSTLNGLYGTAAAEFEKNNAAIINLNESQARLDASLAELGNIVTPVITAFNNLAATLLEVLSPAIQFISNILSFLISKLATAIGYIRSFFGLGSKKSDVKGIATGVQNVASGTGAIANGFKDATKAAQKFKNTTAGFDELNKVGAPPTASGGGSTPGGGGGGGGGFISGPPLGDMYDEEDLEFVNKIEEIKKKIESYIHLFDPAIEAWQTAFTTLQGYWDQAWPHFQEGLSQIATGLGNLGTYVATEFIPNIINSFSVNLLPMFADIGGTLLVEASLWFETFGTTANKALTNIIIPFLQTGEKIATDVFTSIGTAWQKHGKGILDNFSGVQKQLRSIWDTIYGGVIEPIMNTANDLIRVVWDESLKGLVETIIDAAMSIGENLMILLNQVVLPVVTQVVEHVAPIVKTVVDGIAIVVRNAINIIAGVLKGLVESLNGVITFITGVFTGNWQQAWTGVKMIFKGVFDSLVAVVKVPLNLIIGAINGLIRGIVTGVNTAIRAINKLHFTVPDWVPGIGGSRFGFNIGLLTAPQIPRLAKGGIVTSATLVEAGEAGNEAILPLENNTEWMDKLASKLSERQPTKIILNVDGKQLGWATINNINYITKQTGELQLAVC